MWRWIAIPGAGIGVVALSLWLFLLVSMRTGYAPALSVIRRLNRRLMNRRAMQTAGEPGAYASVIRHVGRNTGNVYETPVGVVDTDEGLLISLPYGTTPDWLKNVLAAGSAEMVHEGNAFSVADPELVPAASVARHHSSWNRLVQRLYGVDLVLRLQKVEARVGR